ncbi:MAG: sugar ABC transporter substrate-binding protein [Synechococcus sp. SB0668_bin_15]|nr:sugar ABC transporter substrate-binding protein [Synechococcus sp. SB0668_bin_15]MXZ82679.1 sugar ABC transporter substrate-binding protein [Synechococcus sp. SB0666_bin_14]MYA90493.1 sugar ABC transporter substrate-binding protein [Synechococcus sp. SB0663_bin_10]MYC49956.1 sugar ABC transporter substrate-binding protein [Synechococcus sp. SB0662_bin_14]MYG46156.1 sugar ABC transporter substrate-binding protein [Synechococcus sp. SB0675_bin_6]MYJ59214.1 sugar ABC transporter substrate-bind
MNPAIRLLTVAGLAGGLFASPAMADGVIVGLITKTDTNPFFVTIREEAFRKAAASGIELRTFAGNHGGDTETQVDAVESLVAMGAQGILITPSDPEALAHAVKAARDAGLLVIALDTPFDPADTVDATFTTDNFQAGQLIGTWARATMGDAAKEARIATLDGTAAQPTVDVLRNQGFLKGFGIDIKDPQTMYDEEDPRIVGRDTTLGSREGGRAAMEKLIRQEPDINLVYAINEPAAAGAYEALKALGMENNVLIVSIDGGCPGIRSISEGALGATAMQYPLPMARLGMEAVMEFIKTGEKPHNTPGLDFYDTGVTLVTDQPVDGIPSISTEDGLKTCWESVR